jgi:hypothetical protein
LPFISIYCPFGTLDTLDWVWKIFDNLRFDGDFDIIIIKEWDIPIAK